jgi:hypothetical protein
MRYRACFGDMEKNLIPAAYDTARDKHFLYVIESSVWSWVDGVVDDLKPRRARISTLCAVVYPPRQPKRDRAVKTLRRERDGDWAALYELVKAIDNGANEPIHIDFDLILIEELNEAPRAAVNFTSARARPVTATMIQEDGIASALAAERAGSGHAIGIRDRWRCTDSHCSNYPYSCWLRPGQPTRFENHYPVNGNIIAMWARDINNRKATYDEPSDDVRLAILRQKEQAIRDKTRRRKQRARGSSKSASSGDEDIKSLTKLLIVGQINQMNRQPLREIKQQAGTAKPSASTPTASSQWIPIEYEDFAEINEHTSNFFNSFMLKYAYNFEIVENIHQIAITEGALNINMLMDSISDIMKVWVEYFKLAPGWLYNLRNHAVEWQKSYERLSEQNFRRIDRAKLRDAKQRSKITEMPTSSSVSSEE